MKTSLLLAIPLFIGTEFCLAQAYKPFLKDSAHWSILENDCWGYCDAGSPGDPNAYYLYYTYQLKTDGDTVINNFTYKKLIQAKNGYCTNSGHPCASSSPLGPSGPCQLLGLIWEDTLVRKVFIKKINQPYTSWCLKDSVLFDFSKQAGDTMSWQASCVDTLFIVDSVGFSTPTRYSQIPVKTWYLSRLGNGYFGSFELYESIGASAGFYGGHPWFEGFFSTTLTGYCIGSDSLCGFTCDQHVGISDQSDRINSILLYPNPTRGILNLDLQISSFKNLTIIFTDLLGRAVLSENIIKAQSEINISHLIKGLYLWHLTSDGQTRQSGKVMTE